ncbi:hypothetical protein TEA_019415 [Camellia sinensis var. sinensis]|uniref:Armadillo repeat-containing domain-containing protein n=1 Tax=Camellia sinensis var. sinensis TaxID=542762 RepID=A0A4S4DS87_CAMSN|nr:hypothetical protein TEA_019415 [Camellia sinensis var. sinensis]
MSIGYQLLILLLACRVLLLVALANSCSNASPGLQERAAGALWGLSVSEANRWMRSNHDNKKKATALSLRLAALALPHFRLLETLRLDHFLPRFSPKPLLRNIFQSNGFRKAMWDKSVTLICGTERRLDYMDKLGIAIGREGGVAPLIALANSECEDVHETAAGALWNLAFTPGNALRIVEEGGVPALVHLCFKSASKMARFMAALALAYMFDGRMDEFALVGTSSESISKSVNLDGARRMALRHIETFILTFSDPHTFAAAAASSAPAALAQVTESARIQEAAEVGRFVAMLRNPSSILKACAAFALLQFTIPGGRHAVHHVGLLQNAGAPRVLRAAAAAATAPLEAKIFARIVLRNLEHHQIELQSKE